MTSQKGLLKIGRWTPETIDGKPADITQMKTSTGVLYGVKGVIRAEWSGEDMYVVIEGLDDSCNVKRVPMITQKMLDSAEERNGVLFLGLR